MASPLHNPPPLAGLRLSTMGPDLGVRAVGESGGNIPLLGPGKPFGLLVYLSCCPRRTATRDHLMAVLWADVTTPRARQALRQTVYALRRTLGEGVLQASGETLTLHPGVRSDHDDFLAAIEADDPATATALYAGDFLPDFAVPGGAQFEQWAEVERRQLRQAFLRAAEQVVARHLHDGELHEAQDLARRARDIDPVAEQGWRLLLATLRASGDVVGLMREGAALRAMLEDEGRKPEPATAELMATGPQPVAHSAADAAPPRELWPELVGREREFAALLQAWEGARAGRGRHVAVVGASGIGKTRLLNELGQRLRAAGGSVVPLRASPAAYDLAYGFAASVAWALAALPGAVGVSPGSASALMALDARLSSRFSAPADASTGEDALRRRALAIGELLEAVAEEKPLALLLDDVHWADPLSRRLLRVALDRVPALRVLCVSTSRPSSAEPVRTEHTQLVSLAALEPAELAGLVASLGVLPHDRWADRVGHLLYRASNGSPLLALSALQLALDRGLLRLADGQWGCPDPARLEGEWQAGSALRARLTALEGQQPQVLLALATAGAPLPVADVAALALVPEGTAGEALADLEVRGVVRRDDGHWAAAHDELAATCRDLAGEAACREMHRRLGRLYLAQGDSRVSLVRALRQLREAGETAALGDVLTRWVRLARRQGDRRPARLLAAELVGTEPEEPLVRQLEARLPWSLRRRGEMAWWPAAAAAVVSVAAVLWSVWSRPAALPADAVLVATRLGEEGRLVALEVPIRWDTLAVHPAVTPPQKPWRRLPITPSAGETHLRVVDPASGALAIVRSGPGGRPDVALLRPDGTVAGVASSPHDEVPFAFSPDGTRLLIGTTRWAPPALRDLDLAIVEVGSGTVHPLTRGRSTDFDAAWSPDGSHIAFVRRHFDTTPTHLCLIAPDGGDERCQDGPGGVTRLWGWLDPRTVLLSVARGEASVLVAQDLVTRTQRPVDTQPTLVAVSPDGRLVACLCLRPGDDALEWYIYRPWAPQDARRVDFGRDRGGMVEISFKPGRRPPVLRRVTIVDPPGEIPVDGDAMLQVVGRDSTGAALPLFGLRWRAADSGVARVDSSGRVVPVREGRVTIHVTAGGWQGDSAAVTVGPPRSTRVFEESWADAELPAWVPYGEPRPIVTRESGRRAFLVNGDGSYRSGAYSRAAWSARAGLGLEALVSTSITRDRWQLLALSIGSQWDGRATSGWDHRTGAPPMSPRRAASACGFSYADEGADAWRWFTASGGQETVQLPAGPALRTGRWYRVRLQVFPDGRCGVAVNDTVVWRSRDRIPLDEPLRITIDGASVGTRILVGPVTAWTGVRNDVDWRSGDGRR